MKTIAVLGGGIGGLAASHYLCKSSQVTKVILLESSSRFGGWLSSTRRSDGAVFEHGPRGIRPAGAVGHNTLNMVDDLSLGGEVLPVTSDHVASKNRYLYVNKRLHRMPSGFRSVVVKKELSRKAQLTIYRSIYVPTLTCGQELWVVTERMRSRLKGASFLGGLFHTVPPFSRPLLWSVASEILVKKSKSDDESIHSFVSRRLGKELADIAVDSLCRGVFAGDCRKLSVRSCFPPLFNAEQRRGSLTLGMLLGSGSTAVVPPGPLVQRSIKESWTQWSLRRGLESLPESITDFLQQSGRVELHRGAAIKHVIPSASGWEIHLEDGVLSVDHIISALPAKALSSALPSSCQPLIQQLQDICNVTVAVVNLEYEGSILPVTGFGHLLPSSEDRGVLGVVYDSVPFPQHNRPNGETTRLTVMMGGAWFQEVFGAPDAVTEECLLAKASEAVSQHLGVTTEPSWSRVSLQKDCIPQYYQGHYKSVEIMRRFIKEKNLSLSLIGSSYDGVSVNDVIFGGRTAVQELLGSEV